jgi:hypothetical protein
MSGHIITDADLSAAADALAVLTDIAPTQAAAGDLQAAADYASRVRARDAATTIKGVMAAQRIVKTIQDHRAGKKL